MKIVTLVENTAIKNLVPMHGLSLYVETFKHKILIDLGDKDLFFQNALKLDIDISKVDIAIITHGHNDHGGGLKCFLENNKTAKIYIQKSAFKDYFVKTDAENFIGLDKLLRDNPQINLISGGLKVDEEIQLIVNPKLAYALPAFNSYLYEKENGILKHDKFLHEQSVILASGSKTLLIGGCAHCGIVNIIEDAYKKIDKKINYCISGFHLFNPGLNQTDFEPIEDMAKKLLKTGIKIYTCHCTGTEAFKKFKEIMGDNIEYLSTGNIINI